MIIYNSLGVNVKTINTVGLNNINLDITNLKTGTYWIKVGSVTKNIIKYE